MIKSFRIEHCGQCPKFIYQPTGAHQCGRVWNGEGIEYKTFDRSSWKRGDDDTYTMTIPEWCPLDDAIMSKAQLSLRTKHTLMMVIKNAEDKKEPNLVPDASRVVDSVTEETSEEASLRKLRKHHKKKTE